MIFDIRPNTMNCSHVQYARSENKKKIIILNGDLMSLRCRQRNRKMDGSKVTPISFVSFKEMERENAKNKSKVYGPFDFYTMSRL
tara:strand:+ start:361 stop:615 length:255 start_codon:yes stop_codon:yes gene_type:complete